LLFTIFSGAGKEGTNMESTVSIIGNRCAKLTEIKMQADRIVEKFAPEKIILFGSYARGNPTVESDVDLLVIVDTNKSTWKLSSEISLALDHTFPLDIIVKTHQQIKQRLENGDFFIEDILNHGKIIYERTDQRMGE
jgi:predicted nucleotidyltransferase